VLISLFAECRTILTSAALRRDFYGVDSATDRHLQGSEFHTLYVISAEKFISIRGQKM
jgi:hypothetical protein